MIGSVCILAAIVGGGLKAFGIELPALQSWGRQGILAIFGLVLMVAANYNPSSAQEVVLFDDITNNGPEFSFDPHKPAEFSVPRPYYITSIWNYHWRYANEITSGNIGLRRDDGKVFGPWEVSEASYQEGVISVGEEVIIIWEVKPNTEISAGTHTIIDSGNRKWLLNEESKYRGMSKIKGRPAGWGILGY